MPSGPLPSTGSTTTRRSISCSSIGRRPAAAGGRGDRSNDRLGHKFADDRRRFPRTTVVIEAKHIAAGQNPDRPVVLQRRRPIVSGGWSSREPRTEPAPWAGQVRMRETSRRGCIRVQSERRRSRGQGRGSTRPPAAAPSEWRQADLAILSSHILCAASSAVAVAAIVSTGEDIELSDGYSPHRIEARILTASHSPASRSKSLTTPTASDAGPR